MARQVLREYDIPLVRLENKTYEYEYELNKSFFEAIPDSLIEDGQGKARLVLEKSETMMQLHFDVQLSVELTCDVSLKEFNHDIKTERTVIVKYGEEDEELSEEIIVIANGTQILNVASFIYEFACLEIPMKKIHPDLRETDRPDLVYASEIEEPTPGEDDVDPRWAALKKLRDK